MVSHLVHLKKPLGCLLFDQVGQVDQVDQVGQVDQVDQVGQVDQMDQVDQVDRPS